MDYITPLNGTESDKDRPYVDADPQKGIMGSIPSGKAIEQPMREIVNAIKGAGIEPEKDNVTQLSDAIKTYVTQGFPGGGIEGQVLTKTVDSMVWKTPETAFLESFRFEMIGAIFSINSTPSNASFVTADGREILFSNYPELQTKITGNKLLCIEFDADGSTRAKMLGAFMYNVSKTGVFLPDLGGHFIRYTHAQQSIDAERTVGSVQDDAIRNIIGTLGASIYGSANGGACYSTGSAWGIRSSDKPDPVGYFDASRAVPTAPDNRPYNIAFTPLIYLGKTQG